MILESNPHLLTWPAGYLSLTHIYIYIWASLEIGVHGLRHSFASLAFSSEVGLTEREVMEIGGWADSQTVHRIYEHLARKNRLKASNKMADFFKNADENADGISRTVENKGP